MKSVTCVVIDHRQVGPAHKSRWYTCERNGSAPQSIANLTTVQTYLRLYQLLSVLAAAPWLVDLPSNGFPPVLQFQVLHFLNNQQFLKFSNSIQKCSLKRFSIRSAAIGKFQGFLSYSICIRTHAYRIVSLNNDHVVSEGCRVIEHATSDSNCFSTQWEAR